MTKTNKKYRNQVLLNWLSPYAVSTIAAPRPVVTLTLIPPIMEQTRMYQNMLLSPYLCGGQSSTVDVLYETHLGPKYTAMTRETEMRTPIHARKPGAMKSFSNSKIFPGVDSDGPESHY